MRFSRYLEPVRCAGGQIPRLSNEGMIICGDKFPLQSLLGYSSSSENPSQSPLTPAKSLPRSLALAPSNEMDRCQFTSPGAKTTANNSFQIFQCHLLSEWTRTKTPYGLSEALESAQHDLSQEPKETAAIFLKCGFQAWLAYFLATQYQGHHYKGQRETLNTITAFDQLPCEDRTIVAAAVNSIESHETVRDAIAKLTQSRKRRRTLVPHSLDSRPNLASGLTSIEDPALPTTARMPALQDAAETSFYTNGAITTSTASATLETSPPSGAIAASGLPDQEQTCRDASYHGIMDIFLPYICTAIKPKEGGRADVTMAFPSATHYGLKPHCLISLVIKASEVAHIAMQLFGVHIGSGDGMRYFVLPNGGRLLASNGFQFQGSLSSHIDGLLGPNINKAITESPVREEELAQGIVATRCVTMSFISDPQADGILNLSLGLNAGLEMRSKLYHDDSR